MVSGQLDGQKSDISLKRKLCVMMSYVAVILLASSLVLDVTKVMISTAQTTFQRKRKLDLTCDVAWNLC